MTVGAGRTCRSSSRRNRSRSRSGSGSSGSGSSSNSTGGLSGSCKQLNFQLFACYIYIYICNYV